MENLRELIRNIISENLDENEKKIIAFHGSSKIKTQKYGLSTDIDIFDTSGHWAQRVAGAYFSPDFNEAKKYAKHKGDKIYKVELSFKNLANREDLDKLVRIGKSGIEAREILIRNGFDGLYDEPMKEIVVFNSDQIKKLEVKEIV